MKIKVTQDDIDNGLRYLPNSCPIGAMYFVTSKFERLPLPPVAKEFIKRFDNRGTVKPFEFELGLPAC